MFSNDSPEVCGARTAALPRLCQFQLNRENGFAPGPCRAEVFQQGPGHGRSVGKASDLGQDRER